MIQFVAGVFTMFLSAIYAATTLDGVTALVTALGIATAGVIVAVTGLVKVLRRLDGAAKVADTAKARADTAAVKAQSNTDRITNLEANGSTKG